MSKVTGQIVTATRLPSSVNGNPRFRIVVLFTPAAPDRLPRYETFTTKSDAACAFDVENLLPRPHLDQDAPVVALTFTRAGRVETITRVPA